jgi:hypothetical protein
LFGFFKPFLGIGSVVESLTDHLVASSNGSVDVCHNWAGEVRKSQSLQTTEIFSLLQSVRVSAGSSDPRSAGKVFRLLKTQHY